MHVHLPDIHAALVPYKNDDPAFNIHAGMGDAHAKIQNTLADDEHVPIHGARLVFRSGVHPTNVSLPLHDDQNLDIQVMDTDKSECASASIGASNIGVSVVVVSVPIVLHEAVVIKGLGLFKPSCEGHPLKGASVRNPNVGPDAGGCVARL